METLTEDDARLDPIAPWDAVIEGYDQEKVDDFLRAVATEKVRLHSEIEDARRRERRALSLVHMHETMLTSLRAAYTDVMVNRWAAEARATTMLEDAARRVRLGDLGDVRR